MATATAERPARSVKPPKVKDQPLFIGGKWLDSVSGKTFATHQPRHRRDHLPGRRGRQGRHRPGREGRPQGLRGRPLAEDERRRARPTAAQARRPDREAPGGTRRPRIARQRQAARATPSTADLPLTIKCYRYYAGWADKIHGKTIPIEGNLLLLHAARTGRRRRPDHSVELPAADAGVEVGPGPGVRQHRRPQAGRADAADRSARRRAGPGGRLPRRRHQRRARLRPDRRRRAVRPHGRGQDRLHRRDTHRPDRHGSGRPEQPEARQPGTGRQEPRTSSSPTPTSTPPSKGPISACSSTRASAAAPAAGCSSRRRSTTSSSRSW